MDGFLLVNKPSGPSSYDMIRWIKPCLMKGTKIGHAGTLDPLASGLLIILLGKATKRQSDIMGSDKIYRCRMRLGLKTDTGDITGKPLSESNHPFSSHERLFQAFSSMVGSHQQMPPMYSALKHNGVPLYKLARKGKTVERKPRSIDIRWLEPLTYQDNDAEFRVRCSSGTYVRTLVEDLGDICGVGATMVDLVREAIGPFSLDRAIDGMVLKSGGADAISKELIPLQGQAA